MVLSQYCKDVPGEGGGLWDTEGDLGRGRQVTGRGEGGVGREVLGCKRVKQDRNNNENGSI
jgi:hypothetical protein